METKPQTKFSEFSQTLNAFHAALCSIDNALDSIASDSKYVFCIQVHKLPLRIDCWDRERGPSNDRVASFCFHGSGELDNISFGEYTDAEVAEMRAIIDKWLAL